MRSRAVVRIDARDYDITRGWQLAEWCRTHGADQWSLTVMTISQDSNVSLSRFDEAIKTYALPNGRWVLNTASLAFLRDLLPDGVFCCRPSDAGWFEDLILYRNSEPILEVSSHNGEAYLSATSEELKHLALENLLDEAVTRTRHAK